VNHKVTRGQKGERGQDGIERPRHRVTRVSASKRPVTLFVRLPSCTRATEPSRANSQLSDTQKSIAKSSTSNVATNANPIGIVAQDKIYSVAFLADEEHVVSAGRERIGGGCWLSE